MNNLRRLYQYTKVISNRESPRFVSIDITNKCNLCCKHCLNESGDSEIHNFEKEMTEEEVLNLAEGIVKLKPDQCCICGGEPLLRKELVYKLVNKLSKSGIKVNIVTNGLLLDYDTIINLKKNGICNIQISLDGLGIEHDLFRNKIGAFEKSINSLKLLIKENMNPTVSFCPNIYNYKNIRTYVDYISKLGCNNIRTMPLLLLGRAKKNEEVIKIDDMQLHYFVNEIKQLEKEYTNISIEWGDPLEHILLSKSNINLPMVGFGVSSKGEYYFSPYLALTFGNIKDYDVIEFWEKFKNIRKNQKFQDMLADCKNIYFFDEFNNKYSKINFRL